MVEKKLYIIYIFLLNIRKIFAQVIAQCELPFILLKVYSEQIFLHNSQNYKNDSTSSPLWTLLNLLSCCVKLPSLIGYRNVTSPCRLTHWIQSTANEPPASKNVFRLSIIFPEDCSTCPDYEWSWQFEECDLHWWARFSHRSVPTFWHCRYMEV